MDRQAWWHRAARAGWRRLPTPARNRLRTVLDRRAERPGAPVLSIVVPAYNVEGFVAECLESALTQTLKNVEVIVVDDGSTDGTPAVLAAFAARDDRVRVIRQDNAGQGPARNRGVQESRGTYLTFLDADDTVPLNGYRAMVQALRRSGSDFAVGSVRRTRNGVLSNPEWVQQVHGRDRIGITIDEFPLALLDVIACNRVLRREFWLEQIGGFGPGAYEDHVPMVAAYVRASSFDVLKRIGYHWRAREDQTSTSQQKHEIGNLRDRVAVKREAREILLAEASAAIQAAWTARVLDSDLSLFIAHALRADDEYRQVLQDALATYVADAEADPQVWRSVRVHQKVRTYLAAQGAWDDLEAVGAYLITWGNIPHPRVVDGWVVADEELLDGLSTQVPRELLRLADSEVTLRGALHRVRWVDATTLELTGWAYLRGVDATEHPTTVTGALVDPDGGERLPLAVTGVEQPEADLTSRETTATYVRSGFVATVDVAPLLSGTGRRRLDLELTSEAAGLTRTSSVHDFTAGSSAASPPAAWCEGRLVVPAFDGIAGFGVEVLADDLRTTTLSADGTSLAGTFVWSGPGRPDIVRASRRGTGERVEVRPTRSGGDGAHDFALDLPPVTGDQQPGWDVRVVLSEGEPRLLRWPREEDARIVGTAGAGAAAWHRLLDARAVAVTGRPVLQVEDVEVDDEHVRVTITHAGMDDDAVQSLRIGNDRLAVGATSVEPLDDGRSLVTFPTTRSDFDLPATAVPTGHYRLLATVDGVEVIADAGAGYVGAAPAEHHTSRLNLRLTYARAGEARFGVLPPLGVHERTRYAQRRLRTWFREAELEPLEAVYLQCYRGETAADSQLALHHHLRATRPDLTLYWGVADGSTVLPEGAVPLQLNSERWFETVARARYLCTNVDFDTFFLTRPYQHYVQTFHGYPFKSMGRTFWQGRGFSPGRVEREIARRNAEWDAIVVPSETCAQMYRDEYDYTGEVLVTGYPRCDPLVQPDAGAVRETVLRRLGVDPAATVVLWAPTYRDHLTTRVFAARRFDGLDLDELTERLGPDHVVLVRGHNNNQREESRERGRSRVVDVTDYPDVNDLTLAADVAVLDYSSLRFDWALTGKPMVFFVPDLDTYFVGRPPLFPWDGTAPGPQTSTTAETADALADIDALRERWGPEIEAFNRRFNQLHDGKATARVAEAAFGPRP